MQNKKVNFNKFKTLILIFFLFIYCNLFAKISENLYGIIILNNEKYIGTIVTFDHKNQLYTFKLRSNEIIKFNAKDIKYQQLLKNDKEIDAFLKMKWSQDYYVDHLIKNAVMKPSSFMKYLFGHPYMSYGLGYNPLKKVFIKSFVPIIYDYNFANSTPHYFNYQIQNSNIGPSFIHSLKTGLILSNTLFLEVEFPLNREGSAKYFYTWPTTGTMEATDRFDVKYNFYTIIPSISVAVFRFSKFQPFLKFGSEISLSKNSFTVYYLEKGISENITKVIHDSQSTSYLSLILSSGVNFNLNNYCSFSMQIDCLINNNQYTYKTSKFRGILRGPLYSKGKLTNYYTTITSNTEFQVEHMLYSLKRINPLLSIGIRINI
jgi:hypothetical protein